MRYRYVIVFVVCLLKMYNLLFDGIMKFYWLYNIYVFKIIFFLKRKGVFIVYVDRVILI